MANCACAFATLRARMDYPPASMPSVAVSRLSKRCGVETPNSRIVEVNSGGEWTIEQGEHNLSAYSGICFGYQQHSDRVVATAFFNAIERAMRTPTLATRLR